MELINILTTIHDYIGITGIIALIICFIGPLLTYYFWITARKKGLIIEDISMLDKAFTPTLHNIRDGRDNSYIIVYNDFAQHEAVIKSFPMINKGLRGFCLKKHWNKYKKKCDEIRDYGKSIVFDQKCEFPDNFMIAEDPEEMKRDKRNKKELTSLINNLLKCAKKF